MIIGVATWELQLPGAHSLKDKRMVVRSLKDRIRKKFNVSVAETDHQDTWTRCELTVATVGTDNAFVDSVLDRVDDLIEAETLAIISNTRRERW